MATLQQALNWAKKNPNTQQATDLRSLIEAGKMDEQAVKEGIDLPGRPVFTKSQKTEEYEARQAPTQPTSEIGLIDEEIKKAEEAGIPGDMRALSSVRKRLEEEKEEKPKEPGMLSKWGGGIKEAYKYGQEQMAEGAEMIASDEPYVPGKEKIDTDVLGERSLEILRAQPNYAEEYYEVGEAAKPEYAPYGKERMAGSEAGIVEDEGRTMQNIVGALKAAGGAAEVIASPILGFFGAAAKDIGGTAAKNIKKDQYEWYLEKGATPDQAAAATDADYKNLAQSASKLTAPVMDFMKKNPLIAESLKVGMWFLGAKPAEKAAEKLLVPAKETIMKVGEEVMEAAPKVIGRGLEAAPRLGEKAALGTLEAGLKAKPLVEKGAKTVAETAKTVAKKTGKKIAAPFKEATGKAARTRQIAVTEEGAATFERATAKRAEAVTRSKTTKAGLLEDYKVAEEVVGEKVTPKFTGQGTKFAKETAHENVVAEFWDEPKELLDRGDLGNYAIKISEMSPTGGQSYRAVSKVRKYLLDNTSKKFVSLNDGYSEVNRVLELLETAPFASVKRTVLESKLSTEIISKVKKLKTKDKEAFIKILLKRKKDIGKLMDTEVKNLSGKNIDGEAFRGGLESVLNEQKVTLVRTPVKEITKKDLDRILKDNPDDLRVQQYVEDLKTLDTNSPVNVAIRLEKEIKSHGVANVENVKKLLLQEGKEKTATGDLLRKILPKELVAEIVKTRRITPETWKAIKKKLIGGALLATGWGGASALF